MPGDARTLLRHGNYVEGFWCLVDGHRITLRTWGPLGVHETEMTVIFEDLEDAAREGDIVYVMGQDVQVCRWPDSWSVPREWPCSVPAVALEEIFHFALPTHLRPLAVEAEVTCTPFLP